MRCLPYYSNSLVSLLLLRVLLYYKYISWEALPCIESGLFYTCAHACLINRESFSDVHVRFLPREILPVDFWLHTHQGKLSPFTCLPSLDHLQDGAAYQQGSTVFLPSGMQLKHKRPSDNKPGLGAHIC